MAGVHAGALPYGFSRRVGVAQHEKFLSPRRGCGVAHHVAVVRCRLRDHEDDFCRQKGVGSGLLGAVDGSRTRAQLGNALGLYSPALSVGDLRDAVDSSYRLHHQRNSTRREVGLWRIGPDKQRAGGKRVGPWSELVLCLSHDHSETYGSGVPGGNADPLCHLHSLPGAGNSALRPRYRAVFCRGLSLLATRGAGNRVRAIVGFDGDHFACSRRGKAAGEHARGPGALTPGGRESKSKKEKLKSKIGKRKLAIATISQERTVSKNIVYLFACLVILTGNSF